MDTMILAVHNPDNGEVMSVDLPRAQAIRTLVQAVEDRSDFRQASTTQWYLDTNLTKPITSGIAKGIMAYQAKLVKLR